MEKIARTSLLKDKYVEEMITPAVLNGRVEKLLNDDDYLREQLLPGTSSGREAAYETYTDFFRSRYKVSPEEMMTRKTDAGGTEFSPEGAKLVEAASSIAMVELLTKLVNGDTTKPLPVTVDVLGLFG
jgi:hypothetical protein